MRKRTFRSIDEILASAPATRLRAKNGKTDRVLKSAKLEDRTYANLREGDAEADALERECLQKLPSFAALSRDVYQSFYSLRIRRNEYTDLSAAAKAFNAPILESVMSGDDYKAIKSVCEGRQIPAYEAAADFVAKIAENLDSLTEKTRGEKGMADALEKIEKREDELRRELEELLRQRREKAPDPEIDGRAVKKANEVAAAAEQAAALGRRIGEGLARNKDGIAAALAAATNSAKEKAEETVFAMKAWGQGEGHDDESPERLIAARDALHRIRGNETLAEITKHLGRFKEIATKARKNAYAYGRGEKYSLEYGNDISRAITSEFAALAHPASVPIFMKKHRNKRLLQYKRRERVRKGKGDAIVCLDESDSAKNESVWGKALALALLDAAVSGGRKFALIRFSGKGSFRTDVFAPGSCDADAVFDAVEGYLGGGTDFETPLREAFALMEGKGFKNADVVFVTDGVCRISDAFAEKTRHMQAERNFAIVGILLDAESPGTESGIEPFCSSIFRVSGIARNDIAESLIAGAR
jgi:uncharacterized protein with von Willebrand factor type A (vWA) domain